MHLKTQISRELDRLELLIDQIRSVEAEQETLLAAESKAAPEVGPEKAVSEAEPRNAVAMLLTVKGIGNHSAAILWSEGLSRSSPIAGRSQPMRVLRRRPGEAARSCTSRACRKPAIRGCAP